MKSKIKENALLSKMKKHFPSVSWKKYKMLDHGYDHTVIILDDTIVFRFPKSKEYTQKLGDEVRLLKYLHKKLPVEIPKYNFLSDNEDIAGYKILPGKELTSYRFKQLSIKEKRDVAKNIASFLSALHATPQKIIKKYNVKIENQQKYITNLERDTKRLIFPKLTKREKKIINQYLAELKEETSFPYKKVLAHYDLTKSHILWDKRTKKINIIDFSDRAYTDPAVDFVGLLLYGPKFVKNVMSLYTGRKDANMLKRAQLYYKRVPLWLMKDSFKSKQISFKKGYTLFRKRFKV